MDMKVQSNVIKVLNYLAIAIIFLSCSTAFGADAVNNDDSEGETAVVTPKPLDTFEPFNRLIFRLNEKLDRFAVKPACRFYNKAMPRPLNKGVDHFLDNITSTISVVNDVLQANFYQATTDSWRLAINSTAGVGGFFDVAAKTGLAPSDIVGFGATFERWGYVNSRYIVLPFLGPRTIRDTVGLVLDYYATPIAYFDNVSLRNSLIVLEYIDKRAQLMRFQKVYEQIALDPYVFMRDAYYQNRVYRIARTKQLDDPYTAEDTKKHEDDYYING